MGVPDILGMFGSFIEAVLGFGDMMDNKGYLWILLAGLCILAIFVFFRFF